MDPDRALSFIVTRHRGGHPQMSPITAGVAHRLLILYGFAWSRHPPYPG
jgi:hypothetical protein